MAAFPQTTAKTNGVDMANFSAQKKALRAWFKSASWSQKAPLPPEYPANAGMPLVSALIACLPEGEPIAPRAAFALGLVVNALYEGEDAATREDAKTVIRRLIWQMNEESGNIGWGIPEAFAEILAQNKKLAQEYHSILLSYIRKMDENATADGNYCDNALLRRSCFAAAERLLQAWPEYAPKATRAIEDGLQDEDPECRVIAQRLFATYMAQ